MLTAQFVMTHQSTKKLQENKIMVELTYSPNEEAYIEEEDLSDDNVKVANLPRIYIIRNNSLGTNLPVDLHCWLSYDIARTNGISQSYDEEQKTALINFASAINSLFDENHRRNSLRLKQFRYGLTFYSMR